MGSFVSAGHVICASNEDGSVVELVEPPAEAKVGEVIQFEGLPPVEPDEEVNPNRQDFALGKVRGRNARDRGGCRRLPGECLHDQCRKVHGQVPEECQP